MSGIAEQYISACTLRMLILQAPELWRCPKPGLDVFAVGTQEWRREPLSRKEVCWACPHSSPSPVFGAVDRPLDHSSLRHMVLTNYTRKESRIRDSLHGIPEKGDDLKSKKKPVL